MRWIGDPFFHSLGYPTKGTGAGGVPAVDYFLLKEDGDFLLLETGDKIILE
jgi:hypothetical protein